MELQSWSQACIIIFCCLHIRPKSGDAKLVPSMHLLMCSLSSDPETVQAHFLSSPSHLDGSPHQASLPQWSRCSLGCPELAKCSTYPLHLEQPVQRLHKWLQSLADP